MAKIDELVLRVPDEGLRLALQASIRDLKRQQTFGIVYEGHEPELSIIPNLPVNVGDLVATRSTSDGVVYRISGIRAGKARISPLSDGKERSVALDDLAAVKRFGEPVYPALRPRDSVRRSPERPTHAVINGENFHALQLLLFLYEGAVDCIYIDPPYNTGARDWKYNNAYVDKNDAWRHSRWLSFMEHRLRLAKRLLTRDGVMVIAIDENEHAHLIMLLEQIFPEYDLTSIAVVHNPRGIQGDNFSYTNDFAVYVVPRGQKVIQPREIPIDERESSPFHNWGGESERHNAKNCFYPIYIEDGQVVGFGDVADDGFHPEDRVVQLSESRYEIWPLTPERDGPKGRWVERKWRYARQSVEAIQHQLTVKTVKGKPQVHITKETAGNRTVWQNPRYDGSAHGTKLVRELTGTKFDFPKSLWTVVDALGAVVANKPQARVLDFFGGSGTTLHATLALNAYDHGQRHCILVTNNEVADKIARRLRKQGLRPGDAGFESHGIFEAVTMPRCRAAVTGTTADGGPLKGRYLDNRRRADGYEENVEFFDLTYLDADEVDLGWQFRAILPALWLKAGARGTRPDVEPGGMLIPSDTSLAVLFDESAGRAFARQLRRRPDITHAFITTDSPDVYAKIASYLPAGTHTSMLYRDYLRNFRINVQE